MIRAQLGRRLAVALLLLPLVSACAPGRSIVRGNWPDGRIEPTSVRVMRPAPAVVADVMEEEWTAADPMLELSAADLNRSGVLQSVHFGFDDAGVTSAAQQMALQANAAWLLEHAGARIIVEGHCDERGTRRYNLALGQRRAEAARAGLVAMGIDASRIEVVSYGEELPAVPQSNEAAWSENRRADFIIVAVDR
jgi:peptidoglycan-associated lipoprotein